MIIIMSINPVALLSIVTSSGLPTPTETQTARRVYGENSHRTALMRQIASNHPGHVITTMVTALEAS